MASGRHNNLTYRIFKKMERYNNLRQSVSITAILLSVFILIACSVQPDGHSMHITLQRTGGFAGTPLTKSMDSAMLSVQDAKKLRQMVDQADFFQLPAVMAEKPMPDRFQYRITINQDGKSHTVSTDEAALPEQLRPLVEWLWRHSSN
jgi:hypothetical protein